LLALSYAGECTELAIEGYVKPAVSRWGEIVAALVDGPDLLEWPLDDQLSCIATGFHAPPYHPKRQEMARSARRSRPPQSEEELLTELLNRKGVRIERIASTGQSTPVDKPYCQDYDEWVLLVSGSAGGDRTSPNSHFIRFIARRTNSRRISKNHCKYWNFVVKD
jgi:hypothetical protein